MKKNAYRAKSINKFCLDALESKLGKETAVVAVDVAKREFVVAIAKAHCHDAEHLRFTHPEQSITFLTLLNRLGERGAVELVMEPTGTYGDWLREQAVARGIAVFSVSPKRAHDACEIYDGVPSQHDAKASAILLRLHAQGLSRPWPRDEQARRAMQAAVARLELYAGPFHQHQGRMEALLARHWPELEQHLDVSHHKTPLRLLSAYAGPGAVAEAPEAAATLMAQAARGRLPPERIAQVLASACNSLGTPMLEEERRLLGDLAREMTRLTEAIEQVKEEIARLTAAHPASLALARTVGHTTAAVLVATLGDPSCYPNASSYLKAMGLNVRECSSGESKRPGTGLHITKRGPGLARKYLFLAALRLIKTDPVSRAWYQSRKAYQQGLKIKAVVAVMRKLGKALWHVRRHGELDTTRLFDIRRLKLPAGAPSVSGRSEQTSSAMALR